MYSSYTAASLARELELADRRGVNLEGTLTWAFEFEDSPLFAGFRALATGGIDKPVLNVFRMLSKMGGSRAAVQSSGAVSIEDILAHGIRGKADVSALAAVEPHRISILTWNYHDDDVPGPSAAVRLAVQGLPPSVARRPGDPLPRRRGPQQRLHRVEDHGVPGEPHARRAAEAPDRRKALDLSGPRFPLRENGQADLEFSLPRQAVSLLVLEWN